MKKYLQLIQLSRAIVPLFVMFFHIVAFIRVYFHVNFLNLTNVTKSGGVYYFFALSGFMVYYIYHKKLSDKSMIKPYLSNRLIRIYPLYWVLTILILPIYFIIPSLGNGTERQFSNIVMSFLLFPKQDYPILSVAWSLEHTVYFYLIFSLAFYKNKLVSIGIPLTWALISTAFSLKIISSSNYLINFLFNPINLIFLAGVGCAYLVTKKTLNIYISIIFIILGFAGFPFSWINTQNQLIDISLPVLTSLSSILLIIGIASVDLQKSLIIPRVIQFIGDASFSIYLTHTTCMSAICIIVSSTFLKSLPINIIAFLLMVIPFVSGCIIHYYLEKPLTKKLRKLINKSKVEVNYSVPTYVGKNYK
ncbi:acyltransferase family protein [Bacillus massilinigeriensis]|uniref:acyltransferase family protein n=1 Tax=Bacillus massilionigeriensis TaxID=1805475 RepID=UPI00096B65DF|nr:acyltransferase [Bacillus massilionigeriensis]